MLIFLNIIFYIWIEYFKKEWVYMFRVFSLYFLKLLVNNCYFSRIRNLGFIVLILNLVKVV
jgi:hypothetical protein